MHYNLINENIFKRENLKSNFKKLNDKPVGRDEASDKYRPDDRAPLIGSWDIVLTVEPLVKVQLTRVFFVSIFQLQKSLSKSQLTRYSACCWGLASLGWSWHESLLIERSSRAWNNKF